MSNNELIKIENRSSWEAALESEKWIEPLVDIYETSEAYILIANLPGVSRDNIRIKLENEYLVIMARIDFTSAVKRKYILNENPIGNFYRKFKLSSSVDENKIDAGLENGQLKIIMNKHERVKPKTIEIN